MGYLTMDFVASEGIFDEWQIGYQSYGGGSHLLAEQFLVIARKHWSYRGSKSPGKKDAKKYIHQ
jgi:hypothetical protein